MHIACLDLEGVLVPEVWINFALKTGIDELKATTRDIPDYDQLMRQRLSILKREGLGIREIQAVISELRPLEGALPFFNWLRENFQVLILSDTFYEFGMPLMKQLGYPALFCHRLVIDDLGMISDYKLRQVDQKRKAVRALKDLNFKVAAAGDSYNDTSMLEEADRGIFFRPPQNVIDEFPRYPVTRTFEELKAEFLSARKEFLENMD